MKKLIVPALGFTLVSFSVLSLAASKPTTEKDKLSYSMGVVTGKALKDSQIDINTAAFYAGLTDAQSPKGKLQMTEEEIKQTLQNFRKQQIEKVMGERKKQGEENLKKGQQFLSENAKKPGIKIMNVKPTNGTQPLELQYKIIKSGNGKGASPTIQDTVTFNYDGRTIDGKVFDSSARHGGPVTLAVAQLIQGWQVGLAAMKSGDVWEFYMPPELAYGESGSGPVGPNETLIFKIELVSVAKANQAATPAK